MCNSTIHKAEEEQLTSIHKELKTSVKNERESQGCVCVCVCLFPPTPEEWCCLSVRGCCGGRRSRRSEIAS